MPVAVPPQPEQLGFAILLYSLPNTSPTAKRPHLVPLSSCPGAHGNQLADEEYVPRLERKQTAAAFLLRCSPSPGCGCWRLVAGHKGQARPSTISAESLGAQQGVGGLYSFHYQQLSILYFLT